jgi:hypothetical protein
VALVVEDGTGKSDAEAFTSVADLDTYLTTNRAQSGWTGDATAKEQAARLAGDAFIALTDGRFKGITSESTQRLPWPRSDVVVVEEGGNRTLASNVVPPRVIEAFNWLALATAEAVTASENMVPDVSPGDDWIRVKAGQVEVERAPGGRQTTYRSRFWQLLGPFLAPARVIRG